MPRDLWIGSGVGTLGGIRQVAEATKQTGRTVDANDDKKIHDMKMLLQREAQREKTVSWVLFE